MSITTQLQQLLRTLLPDKGFKTAGHHRDAIIAGVEEAKTYTDEKSAEAVKKTGNETIGGVKTFTSAPVVPDATLPQHPMTLNQGVVKSQIKQTTGAGETDLMSQKAVTDELEQLADSVQPKSITPIEGMTATTVEEGLGELKDKVQNQVAPVIESGTGLYSDPSDMTWSLVRNYRNLDLWASAPMIDIDFRKQYFQHYVGKIFENGADNLTTEYTSEGLKFTNNSGVRITCHYKLPASFLAPSVNFGIRVRKTTTNHRVGITLLNNSNNMLNCFNDLNGYGVKLTNKANGTVYDIAAGSAIPDAAYELHMNWGNSKAALFKTVNEFTSFIGEGAISISNITTPGTFRQFRPAIYIDLQNNQSVTIERFSAGYSEGIGHADFRSVTYENGEPIFKDGKFFVTASSRLMGTNGGSGLITVFSVDRLTFEVKRVGFICVGKSSVLESGTAAKIVYDRDEKRWIYVARAFPSPGGKLHIGTTKQNLIGGGLHILTVVEASQLSAQSLDADLFKENGLWYIGYHGGSPRTLRIAKSADLTNWTEIINQESGEGVSFARFNGKWFVVDARTPFDLGVSEFNVDEETVTFLNNWTLPDNAGITGGVGGNPWGCIVPYWIGNKTEFYLVLFSRDEYIAGLADVFSYGSMWIYNSYQTWDAVSEFTQETDTLALGF